MRKTLSASVAESHPTLTRLFQARNEWDRLYQLSNLLKEAHIDLPDFFDSPVVWSTICRETSPEKLAWRLASEIGKRTGGQIPAALRPYADRPDLDAKDSAEDEARFRQELAHWLENGRNSEKQAPRRELKVVWKLERNTDPLINTIQIELRVSSAKLKEGARNFFQVRGLCNELTNHPELFSSEDAALLRWISDYTPLLLTDKNKNGSPFLTDYRCLLVWLQQWGQSGRCVFEDGTPVEFKPLAARVVPRLDTASNGNGKGGTIHLGFEVVAFDGVQCPLADARLFLGQKTEASRLEPELVWAGDCFYRLTDRPPREILSLALKRGASAFKPAAARELLPKLLRRYPGLQPQVKMHLRQVPAVPHFYFTLDEDDWMQVRCQAAAPRSGETWEWGSDGWIQLAKRSAINKDLGRLEEAAKGTEDATPAPGSSAPVEPAAEVWDEIPAESDTADALEWLRQWEGEPGEVSGHPDLPGWWVPISARKLPILLKLWQERSPHWHFFGNKRFQRLIQGKRRLFPKIKIQATGVDWFTVKTEWEEESLRLTPADWQRFQQSDDPFFKLAEGDWVPREDIEQLEKAAEALSNVGVELGGEEQKINTLQIAGSQATAWNQLEGLAEGDLGAELKKLREMVDAFSGIPKIPVPKSLKAELRPYQEEGLHFLAYASRYRLGAILADDMGLGKTLQALAWLEYLRETEGRKPALVVCPASVVFNWQREAAQFAPEQKVLTLTAGDRRHELREDIPGHDLIVTNYALLRRDLAALKKFSFRAIILDEAQNIKNPDSLVARSAKELRGDHQLALTGTPLENRLLDLWSLVEFVHPGYLPARGPFLEQYDRPGVPQARALLSNRLRPILLRRLKSQVARDLPDRIEERLDCELTEGQRKFYLAELQRSRQLLQEFDPATGQSRQRMHILAALTRLRQICCHPTLAGGKPVLGSGKTAAFLELLEPLRAEGHKVLVFSQFVEMLKLLQGELEQRGIPYHMLTGQTTDREGVVNAFQNDPQPSVFLLSLKAAGTGLNLTAASYVVLYDPWWNPAVEAQAIDRTHRLGQDRTVIAYRLVTRDTVEEKIWALQQRKAQMVKDVLGEQGFTGSLTRDDLEYLLGD
jgi:SNF2 family DNA or RNA helicase